MPKESTRSTRFDRSAPTVNPPDLHLITRSQLAQLRVAPATVVAWLADGSLEQVGAMPDATSSGDAVYSVLSPKLLQELQLKQVEASPLDLAPWRDGQARQESPKANEELAYVDESELQALVDSWSEASEAATTSAMPLEAETATEPATETAMAEEQPEASGAVAAAAEASVVDATNVADAIAAASSEPSPTVAEALDALFGDDGAPATTTETTVATDAAALTADEEVLADSVNEFTDDLAAGLEVEAAAASDAAADEPLPETVPFDEHLAELRGYVGGEAELEPIVSALRDGFEQTRRGLAETTVCLQSIAKRLEEHGPMRPVRVVMNGVAAPNVLTAPPAKAAGIGNAALITSTLLILGWAGVLWWKTGDLRLTIGAIAAANVLACCAVASARR